MLREKAGIESQLGDKPCAVEDTEEIFWLREQDDCQSKVALGNALAAQYRFREAAEAYSAASRIRNNDPAVFVRLGGSYLTLFRFAEASEAYSRALALGLPERSAAYQLGIWHYFQEEYERAEEWFEKALPCTDEMKIAILYWHGLASMKQGKASALLSEYHGGMEVGHHTAYRLAVELFAGKAGLEDALAQCEAQTDPLNFVIAAYGLCGYLDHAGYAEKGAALKRRLLEHDDVWPCISYLAAWRESLSASADSDPEQAAMKCIARGLI